MVALPAYSEPVSLPGARRPGCWRLGGCPGRDARRRRLAAGCRPPRRGTGRAEGAGFAACRGRCGGFLRSGPGRRPAGVAAAGSGPVPAQPRERGGLAVPDRRAGRLGAGRVLPAPAGGPPHDQLDPGRAHRVAAFPLPALRAVAGVRCRPGAALGGGGAGRGRHAMSPRLPILGGTRSARRGRRRGVRAARQGPALPGAQRPHRLPGPRWPGGWRRPPPRPAMHQDAAIRVSRLVTLPPRRPRGPARGASRAVGARRCSPHLTG